MKKIFMIFILVIFSISYSNSNNESGKKASSKIKCSRKNNICVFDSFNISENTNTPSGERELLILTRILDTIYLDGGKISILGYGTSVEERALAFEREKIVGIALRENGLRLSVKFESVKTKKPNKMEDIFYDIYSPYRIEIYLDGVDFSRLPDVKFLD